MEQLDDNRYQLTHQDIVRIRVPTKAVSTHQCVVKGKPLTVFDVGGHRGLRKQWAPFFEEVHVLSIYLGHFVCD